ncbi:MAG TPA: arginine--tRNA ligase [Bacteroidales bacterium]|nr:arginine--tRNA ligase [Bacteroidales bacterium]HSA44742.1 arginine--tRNA ligase [Bacteroidales bacterium]
MISLRIKHAVGEAIRSLYGIDCPEEKIQIQPTRKEFTGDFTVVVFPLTPLSKKSPEETAAVLGDFLLATLAELSSYQVIKGFLNLQLSQNFWKEYFLEALQSDFSRVAEKNDKTVVLEYSSPNTNKPLHLGHIRNNLLGASLARILEANGYEVRRVNLVNDRGIHICKSMLAWQKWGNGETPASSGEKGDHLVGKYYVMFDRHYKEEVAALAATGMKEEEAAKLAPLMLEAQNMLRAWENGDSEVIALWRTMNSWVYEGFAETYHRLGIVFDKTYYESGTYLSGRDLVLEGLDFGILMKRADGSVWCDLTDEGLDEKLLLRSDGTSVYITQDLGTASLRQREFHPDRLIYVVGNEQNYHFDVLRLILKKLGKDWYRNIHHFSYGMVELPEGKMKSREGTVVDADDLLQEMYDVAVQNTRELGKSDIEAADDAEALFWMLALGALKYFILKVDPKKNMVFNPQESIDFNGNTGPFIQYTHARIQSLLRKASEDALLGRLAEGMKDLQLSDTEVSLIKQCYAYPALLVQAAEELSPALIANYLHQLCKDYNYFYQTTPVLRAETAAIILFRLQLSRLMGHIIREGMKLLGIDVPDKM